MKKVFGASPLSIQYKGVRTKTGWLGVGRYGNNLFLYFATATVV